MDKLNNYSDEPLIDKPIRQWSSQVVSVHPDDLDCKASVLRRQSIAITDPLALETQDLCEHLIRVFYSIAHAHGISAIQLGIPLRIALVNVNRERGKELFLINPTIVSLSGRLTDRSEGCLCLPGFKSHIRRRNKITVSFIERNGGEVTYSARGYEAAVIQHEIDHMNGKFYWDIAAGERPKPASEH